MLAVSGKNQETIGLAIAEPVLDDNDTAASAHQGPEAAVRVHEMMVDSGYFGIFRFTRTRRGFSARCPFHRRNKTTDCKKMISVTFCVGRPITREETVMCWRRLATWCLAHGQYERQRDHVAYTPAADDSEALCIDRMSKTKIGGGGGFNSL